MIKKCKVCGELKEHHAKGMCKECYGREYQKRFKVKKRTCKSCNKDISNRHHRSIYCYECAKKEEKIRKEERHKRNKNSKKFKEREKIRGRISYLKEHRKILERKYVEKGMPNYLDIEIRSITEEIYTKKIILKEMIKWN